MREIKESDYLTLLEELIEKKKATINDTNQWVRKKKIMNYAIQKGFEYELVNDLL